MFGILAEFRPARGLLEMPVGAPCAFTGPRKDQVISLPAGGPLNQPRSEGRWVRLDRKADDASICRQGSCIYTFKNAANTWRHPNGPAAWPELIRTRVHGHIRLTMELKSRVCKRSYRSTKRADDWPTMGP
jgi:hypothetical protein